MKHLLPTPDASVFWTGCAHGKFRLQRCRNCRQWRFPPGPVCPGCGSGDGSWQEVSGRGRLLSFAVYRQDFGTGLDLPYVVALVELEEGPRLISRLTEADHAALFIGMDLSLDFRSGPAGQLLPLFKPVPAPADAVRPPL